MRPPEGEASAPDFEKDLEKDPHAADIPDYDGLNVKSKVAYMRFPSSDRPSSAGESTPSIRQLGRPDVVSVTVALRL